MSSRTFSLALIAIVTVALGVRIGAAIDANSIAPESDAADFDRHALSIATGDGYPEALTVTGGPGPSAFRPPLYPFALAGAYALVDTDDEEARWLSGRLLQAVIGTAIVALVALVALQLWGRRPALVAAALAALYPPLILAGTSLLTEPLFTALLVAGVAVLLRYRQSDARARWLILAGALAGLAALTRGNGVAVILAFALGAWLNEAPQQRRGSATPRWRPRLALRSLIAPAIVVAAAVLVVAPWTVRNAIELDTFVPVTTQSGVAVAGQYNDVARENDWRWVGPWGVPAYADLYEDEPLGEAELSRRLTDRGVDYAVDHPGGVASTAVLNTLRFLSLRDPIELERSSAEVLGQPAGLAQASVYAFWFLVLIALAGAFTPAARRLPAFVWAIVPLLLVTVVFVGGAARYRVPLEPFVILLAAAAVGWAWQRAGAARRRPATGA